MKDEFGNRIKSFYEDITRFYLPRKTNLIIRCDGKSFHTYTKDCKRPFDDDLMDDMNLTAIALCEEIQGCKLAYVQSDEINIWATDYDKPETNAWFDNNLQKIVSVSASIATAKFNLLRMDDHETGRFHNSHDTSAHFDSRAFTISPLHEVANFFKWRSDDAARNSVQMVARSLYSHKECENKNNSELQDMIFVKGQNWNDMASRYKSGRIIVRKKVPSEKVINGKLLQFERNVWTPEEMTGYNFEYWNNLVNSLKPNG